MKNLNLCLMLLVSCLMFSNCEQESLLDTDTTTIETAIVFPERSNTISTKAITTEVIEQFMTEDMDSELETRSGREKIAEYEMTVEYKGWANFYFHKDHLDRDCKYIAEVISSHGNPDLYIFGNMGGDDWRNIRYSTNSGNYTDESYGAYHDLEGHEDRLYFSVYGRSSASFKITFYRECDSSNNGNCNCPSNYDPVIGCDGKEYSNTCVAECNGQYCPDLEEDNIHLEFITPIEPENNFRYRAGIDLFVKVDAKDDVGIEEVKLYVNGEFVRSEYHEPYEWGKPHRDDDHLLNNLSAGGYELTAVAINKDGKQKSETIRIGVR